MFNKNNRWPNSNPCVLWCRKRLLCPLCHNHGPCFSLSLCVSLYSLSLYSTFSVFVSVSFIFDFNSSKSRLASPSSSLPGRLLKRQEIVNGFPRTQIVQKETKQKRVVKECLINTRSFVHLKQQRRTWLVITSKGVCFKMSVTDGGLLQSPTWNANSLWGATIAQWICLHLPSCRPGFESQAHHLCLNQFIFEMCHVEKTKINKRASFCLFSSIPAWDWPILEKNHGLICIMLKNQSMVITLK